MICTGVDLNNRTIEEFEELLTKITMEFGYREMALKLRDRQIEKRDGKYGDMNTEKRIDKEFLDSVHNLIIEYVNK